jgi:hypothetical protein
MSESRQRVLGRVIKGCSRVLLLVGAAAFLVGGKLLHEIKHESFLASEGIGVVGGILLMLLGAAIALPGKPQKPSNAD